MYMYNGLSRLSRNASSNGVYVHDSNSQSCAFDADVQLFGRQYGQRGALTLAHLH